MDTHKILIAIDDSKSTEQAVTQVAHKIHDPSVWHIILLHVLRPVPPELLEHGGDEDPQAERHIEAEQDAAQAAWRQQAIQASQPIFDKALAILKQANLPEQAIETRIYAPVPEQDIATAIAEVARDNACGTVVVGRSSYAWLREVMHIHVADKLQQQDRPFQIWVVEENATLS